MKVPPQNRKTKQREAIREVFERAERPLAISEVLASAAKRADGLGVATVYRTVGALLDERWLDAVEIPGVPSRYERAGKAHHHHFQCERCEKVFDIAGCMDNLRKLVPPKFHISGHAVTLFGLCASCSR